MITKTQEALEAAGIDTKKETETGQLILFSERTHLINGRFDTDRMIKLVDQAIVDALKAGFKGLRGTGDAVWEMGDHLDMEKFILYEKKLDKFLVKKKATILCQYNLKVVGDQYLHDSLFCHNAVVEEKNVSLDNHFYNSLYDFPQSSFEVMRNSLRE